MKNGTLNQSTFWSAGLLAKVSPSPVSEAEWMTRAATWPSSLCDWLLDFGRAGSCGKTSLESCRREADGILVPFSGRWQNSGTGGPTESWTLNTSEFPNDAAVCSLSDILETGDVPQRYFLSAKACAGILRRAEKRGKDLPSQLRRALEQVAGDSAGPENREDKIR